MKFLSFLQEEYCELFKNSVGKTTEVYINPSSDDIKAIKKFKVDDAVWFGNIRFTADARSKKLFVWSALICNHADMIDYLISRKEMKSVPTKDRERGHIQYAAYLLNGTAKISGKKLQIIQSDEIESFVSLERKAAKLGRDWLWMKPYFIDIDYIQDMKDKAE